MPFAQDPVNTVTGIQKITAYLNLLNDYILGGENTEGASVGVTFEDGVTDQNFTSYMVYTVRLPATKELTDEGVVTYDPYELP